MSRTIGNHWSTVDHFLSKNYCFGMKSEQHNRQVQHSVNKIHQLLDEIFKIVGTQGITLKNPSQGEIEDVVASVTDAERAEIENKISCLAYALRSFEKVSLDKQTEVKLLKTAATRLGFIFGDTHEVELSEKTRPGDVIEIYNLEGIQIYRNLEFFRHCSYSVLDLVVMSWGQLYERPKMVVKLIEEAFKSILTHKKPIELSNLPTHVLRERYLDSKKAFLMRHKWLIPLTTVETSQPAAVISILSTELVADNEEGKKFETI